MHCFTKTNEKSAGLNAAKEQINLHKQPKNLRTKGLKLNKNNYQKEK